MALFNNNFGGVQAGMQNGGLRSQGLFPRATTGDLTTPLRREPEQPQAETQEEQPWHVKFAPLIAGILGTAVGGVGMGAIAAGGTAERQQAMRLAEEEKLYERGKERRAEERQNLQSELARARLEGDRRRDAIDEMKTRLLAAGGDAEAIEALAADAREEGFKALATAFEGNARQLRKTKEEQTTKERTKRFDEFIDDIQTISTPEELDGLLSSLDNMTWLTPSQQNQARKRIEGRRDAANRLEQEREEEKKVEDVARELDMANSAAKNGLYGPAARLYSKIYGETVTVNDLRNGNIDEDRLFTNIYEAVFLENADKAEAEEAATSALKTLRDAMTSGTLRKSIEDTGSLEGALVKAPGAAARGKSAVKDAAIDIAVSNYLENPTPENMALQEAAIRNAVGQGVLTNDQEADEMIQMIQSKVNDMSQPMTSGIEAAPRSLTEQPPSFMTGREFGSVYPQPIPETGGTAQGVSVGQQLARSINAFTDRLGLPRVNPMVSTEERVPSQQELGQAVQLIEGSPLDDEQKRTLFNQVRTGQMSLGQLRERVSVPKPLLGTTRI